MQVDRQEEQDARLKQLSDEASKAVHSSRQLGEKLAVTQADLAARQEASMQ